MLKENSRRDVRGKQSRLTGTSKGAKKAWITMRKRGIKRQPQLKNKNPNMVGAGHTARRTKQRNEGLTDLDGIKTKYDVMKVYSKRSGFSKPTCSCCKNNDWKFLVFDHMDDKLKKKHRNLSGIDLAKRLKEENYPKKMQILCWNCNSGKEITGGKYCAHHLSPHGQKKLKSVGLPIGKILKTDPN